MNTEANSEQWEEWFKYIADLKAEEIKVGGKYGIVDEEFMPPELSNVKCSILKECCRSSWREFYEWWNMKAGGRNAINFLEQLGGDKIRGYINEVESKLGREVKPFSLNIELIYTGINEAIDINDEFVINPLSPIITLDKEWWMKKLIELG